MNADVPDSYRVDTPEQVDLAYDVAGLGSRFLATLIDSVIQTIVLITTFLLCALGLRWALGSFQGAGDLAIAGVVLVSFAVWWGYHVFFEIVWRGQSPGKRAVGLRVIKDGGYPIGLSEALVRNVLRIVDILPGTYAIGGLVMFLDRRSRRLGDMAAGTLVIKERRELELRALHPATFEAVEPGEPIPNLGRLTGADHALLRDYLARRPQLSSAAEPLATQLAGALAARLGYAVDGESATAFLDRLAVHLGISVGPGGVPVWSTAPRTPRRYQPWVIIAAALGTFVVIAGCLFSVLPQRSSSARATPVPTTRATAVAR
jgi:uncharacterized RDD family membrane protein YckC